MRLGAVLALFLTSCTCGGATPPAGIDAAVPPRPDAARPDAAGVDAGTGVPAVHGEGASSTGVMRGGRYQLKGVLGPVFDRTPMSGGNVTIESGSVVKP